MSEWTKGHDLVDLPFVKLAFAEHDKLVSGIADNAKSMYEWFQIKFIFIGSIFVGVFFKLYFRSQDPKQESCPDNKRFDNQIGWFRSNFDFSVCLCRSGSSY